MRGVTDKTGASHPRASERDSPPVRPLAQAPSVIERRAHISVFRRGGGHADAAATTLGREATGTSDRKRVVVARRIKKCHGISEMLAPNHKRRRTRGGLHSDDTDSDADADADADSDADSDEASVTGPGHSPPRERHKSSSDMLPGPSECGLESRTPRSAEIRWAGRIPRLSGRGGGQSTQLGDGPREELFGSSFAQVSVTAIFKLSPFYRHVC